MKLSKSDRKNALKHTYVKIIFTMHELKTFCIEAYSVLGLCLHMQTPFFTLSSPRLLWYVSLYMALMRSSVSLL